jgi:meso-butanediol dehydrogenase / (S,S)-butanediol dehydrogenase / diacetyl reductase
VTADDNGVRLEGKVALISGSTKGIGRAIAEMCASQGAKVAVTGRSVDLGEAVASDIREKGGSAAFFAIDIMDEASVRTAVEAAARHFGKLDILVNNAAPTELVRATARSFHEYSSEEWEGIIRGTLTGNVFWSSKYAFPYLSRSGSGSIINISSAQATVGVTGFSAYGAAKGAINALTFTLAVELAPHNVRVNTIVVGRVISDPTYAGPRVGLGHLTRLGEPSDIAYATVWLASDEAAYVTGALIPVDGGFTINGDALVGLRDQLDATIKK